MRDHLPSIEPACKRTSAYRRFAVLPGRTKETSGLNSLFVSHETSRLYTESYAGSCRCRRRTRRPPAQSCTRSTSAGVARALCTLRRGSAWRRFFFGDGPRQVESHTTGLKSTRRESPMCFRKTAGLLPRGMRDHLQSIEPVCKRTAAYRRFAVLPGRTKETSGLNSIFVSHETSRLYTESYAGSCRCRRKT